MVNLIDKKGLFMYILTLYRYYKTLVPINWIALSLEGLITPPNGNKEMGIGHFPKKCCLRQQLPFIVFFALTAIWTCNKKVRVFLNAKSLRFLEGLSY